MFTTPKNIEEFRALLMTLIETHGPISAERLAKLVSTEKKAYEIRNSIQAMRIEGYPVETVDGLIYISE